jgi:hypothetical protein
MTKQRLKYLRQANEAENLSLGELIEIQAAFEQIPDDKLRDLRENAMASDMLEEIESNLPN